MRKCASAQKLHCVTMENLISDLRIGRIPYFLTLVSLEQTVSVRVLGCETQKGRAKIHLEEFTFRNVDELISEKNLDIIYQDFLSKDTLVSFDDLVFEEVIVKSDSNIFNLYLIYKGLQIEIFNTKLIYSF